MKISWDSILKWKGQLVLVGVKSAPGLFKGRLAHMDQDSLTIEGVAEGADRLNPPDYLNPAELREAVVPLKPGEKRRFDRDDLDTIEARFDT